MQNADLTEKKHKIIKYKKIIFIYKSGQRNFNVNIEIKKSKFYHHIFLGDVDIEKVLVPNKISFGEKN